MKSIVKNCM